MNRHRCQPLQSQPTPRASIAVRIAARPPRHSIENDGACALQVDRAVGASGLIDFLKLFETAVAAAAPEQGADDDDAPTLRLAAAPEESDGDEANDDSGVAPPRSAPAHEVLRAGSIAVVRLSSQAVQRRPVVTQVTALYDARRRSRSHAATVKADSTDEWSASAAAGDDSRMDDDGESLRAVVVPNATAAGTAGADDEASGGLPLWMLSTEGVEQLS